MSVKGFKLYIQIKCEQDESLKVVTSHTHTGMSVKGVITRKCVNGITG